MPRRREPAQPVDFPPAAGRVAALTVWPVKSMSGATPVSSVAADVAGLAGDREFAVVDRRPMREGHVVSARNLPGLLRWTAEAGEDGPRVTAPDGGCFSWSDAALPRALRDDLGVDVEPAPRGRYSDLADSVLVTTLATHAAVEERFGEALDGRRWRTNVVLDVDAPAFSENRWEGGTITVGDGDDTRGVVLRLLHPCKRCTIPTWAPDGSARRPDLLLWFLANTAGVFGINARVERPGELRVGADVAVRPA